MTADTTGYRRGPAPYFGTAADIWLLELIVNFYVVTGGSALGASHKWDLALQASQNATDNVLTTISITNNSIASGASANIRRLVVGINGLLNNGTLHDYIQTTWNKTGTPGNLQTFDELTYRIVAT
jgi:hypothetical protein